MHNFLNDKNHPSKKPKFDLQHPHSHNSQFHYKRPIDEPDIVKIMPVNKIYFGTVVPQLMNEKNGNNKSKITHKKTNSVMEHSKIGIEDAESDMNDRLPDINFSLGSSPSSSTLNH